MVWPVLYSAIGFAAFVVWTEGGFRRHAGAFVLYAVQLGLNAAWAPAFFKAHNFSLASIINLGDSLFYMAYQIFPVAMIHLKTLSAVSKVSGRQQYPENREHLEVVCENHIKRQIYCINVDVSTMNAWL